MGKHEIFEFCLELCCVVFGDHEHELFELLDGAKKRCKLRCKIFRWTGLVFEADENIDLQTSVGASIWNLNYYVRLPDLAKRPTAGQFSKT